MDPQLRSTVSGPAALGVRGPECETSVSCERARSVGSWRRGRGQRVVLETLLLGNVPRGALSQPGACRLEALLRELVLSPTIKWYCFQAVYGVPGRLVRRGVSGCGLEATAASLGGVIGALRLHVLRPYLVSTQNPVFLLGPQSRTSR